MGERDLPATINEVRQLATTEPDRFWSPQMRSHHARLIEAEQRPGGRLVAVIDRIAEAVGPDFAGLDAAVSELSESLRQAMADELSDGLPLWPDNATTAQMSAFHKEGLSELLNEWGHTAAQRAGMFYARVARFHDRLGDDALDEWIDFWGRQPIEDRMALIKALT